MVTRCKQLVLGLAMVAAALSLLQLLPSAAADGASTWRQGRASYYGTDAWSIHRGSCGYGYIWKDEPLGWDVAAMTDVHYEYDNSCGTCYEVKCDPQVVHDNYGQRLDRYSACTDQQASIVVRIVDTCPCYYPANQYSNKRWCCGDMDHFDMSVWAFEKLADKKWGVMAIKYRRVSCDHKPEKEGWTAYPTQPHELPPAGLAKPENHCPVGRSKPSFRDWPEYLQDAKLQQVVFDDWFQPSWYQSSWNAWVQPLTDSSQSGMKGGVALCTKLDKDVRTFPLGGIALKSAEKGKFAGYVALEFWLYVGVTGWEGSAATIPDVEVQIAGDQGSCQELRIMNIRPTGFEPRCRECTDYWWKWVVYMDWFTGNVPVGQVDGQMKGFSGCGGNGVYNLDEIRFKNKGWGKSAQKWMCIDNVRLR